MNSHDSVAFLARRICFVSKFESETNLIKNIDFFRCGNENVQLQGVPKLFKQLTLSRLLWDVEHQELMG